MEFNTNAADWTVKKDGSWLMFHVKGASELASRMENGKEYTVTVEEYKPKRSMDANRYLWVLCGKIADALSSEGVLHTKEEIYRQAIKERGIWKDAVVPNEEVEWRNAAWSLIGLGWFTEPVDFTPDGEASLIRFYYGSSRYNSRQMSRVVDKLVQDCKNMGIETMPPDKLAMLLEEWNNV